MYHRRHKHDIVVILALFGFGVSLFLAVSHYLGLAVPCSITKGCETVLASKYSSVAGIPVSVIGVAYYTAVIAAALLANHYHRGRQLLNWFLGLGALAALSFLGIQFFAIKKVCQYCLIVDVTAIVLFLWNLNIEHLRD